MCKHACGMIHKMRKNSINNIRINQEVQKELSNLIRMEVKDPRVSPMTTIVNVEVAPDLKTAKVYISVLGDEKAQQDTIRGLKSAAPFLRSQLAHNMNMRNTPELRFIADQSIEYGVNMSHLIDEITADLHDDENEDEVEVSEDEEAEEFEDSEDSENEE